MTKNDTPPRTVLALAFAGSLIGCSESTGVYQMDAAPADSHVELDVFVRDSASTDSASTDAGAADTNVADASADADFVRYERDVRPLLEASACGDCHEGVGIDMDYSWISAPGETWCTGEEYERRWHCFEEHARTQVEATDQGCDSGFYHRHGEPCFMEETRLQILGWADGGYRE